MILIPDHVLSLKSYIPGKSPEELKQEYGFEKLTVLWNNENNFGASPRAKVEIEKALKNAYLYPDPAALELRQLIANHVGKGVEHIAVENGSEAILNNIFQSFFFDGDELLTSAGSFVAVYIWAQAQNVEVTKIPLANTYGFDLDRIKENISDRTKAIYIANPNNPTGAIINRMALREFVEDIPEDILVIIDEAYFEFASELTLDYPNSIKFSKSNVITLRTFSKAYGVAGVRIGYAVGAPEVIEALNKVKMTFAPSNLAQAAGVGAIQDQGFLKDTVDNNTHWIKEYYKTFEALNIRYVNSGGNFVMMDLKTPEKAEGLTRALMEKGVFVRHLIAFGLPHCIRVSIGKPEDNQHFIDTLKEVF